MGMFSKAADNHSRVPGGEARDSSRLWTAWKWIEWALLLTGLSLAAVYGAARLESWLGSQAVLKSISQVDVPVSTAVPEDEFGPQDEIPGSSSGVSFAGWAQNRVRAYTESLSYEFAPPIGVIEIPKIHLAVPLLDGTDYLTLNHAVGRIAGTARPGEQGNIGIAGHRDGFFRDLQKVKVGDAVELKTRKGTATYVVDQIRIVKPENIEVLRPRAVPSLTLVTCYPFHFIGSAPQRYIVRASLTHESGSGSGSSIPDSESLTNNSKEEK